MATNVRMATRITTAQHKKYWGSRKIDWATHYGNWDHPHRFVISSILSKLPWFSLIEIGCGAGANLINIVKNIPGRQLGGVDVNPDAIETAQKFLTGAMLRVGSGDDVMLSDKSVDVILTDMMLIYVSPRNIDSYIKELRRLARNYVVLCEFHHSSFIKRLLLRLKTGYNAYNYEKLLQQHDFYDILTYKLTEKDWPGGDPQRSFGNIIVARVPKYV